MKVVGNFYRELKRRQVLRACALYAGSAWLLVGICDIAFPMIDAPHWALPAVVWTALIGLPITALISWFVRYGEQGYELETEEDVTPVRARSFWDVTIVSVLLAALAVSVFINVRGTDQLGSSQRSIAVLPFRDLSPAGNHAYLAEGIAEELLNTLIAVEGLTVVSKNSSFKFHNSTATTGEIARQLNVANVLEGSVRIFGEIVRISVQMVDAKRDTNRWSVTYERSLDDIFNLQDQIAVDVAKEFQLAAAPRLPMRKEVDPQAYKLFLQARHQANLFTKESLNRAAELSQQALEVDDEYVDAIVLLADVYTTQAGEGHVDSFADAIEQARALLLKALSIEPRAANALQGLAWIAMRFDNDLKIAAAYTQQAVQYELADARMYHHLASLLVRLGRLDDAVAFATQSASFNPLEAFGHANLGVYNMFAGQYEESIDAYQRALTLSPNFIGANYAIGLNYLYLNDPEEALQWMQREQDDEFRVKGLTLTHFVAGRSDDYEKGLSELIEGWGHIWPSEVAEVYAFTGNLDEAFAWIEKDIAATEGMGWAEAVQNPNYRSLHQDARWLALRERIGLSAQALNQISLPLPKI